MRVLNATMIDGPLRPAGKEGSFEFTPSSGRVLLQIAGSVSSSAPPCFVGIRPELDGKAIPDPTDPKRRAAARIFDLRNPSRQAVVPLSVEVEVEAGRPHRLALRPLNPNTRTDSRDRFSVTILEVEAPPPATSQEEESEPLQKPAAKGRSGRRSKSRS